MSFREKSAWVTLITILVVSGAYMAHGMRWEMSPQPSSFAFHALIACTIAFILIEIVAHLILYLRFPKDARTPKDERERLIDLKAERIALYVYVIGSFIAVSLIHAGANRMTLANGVLVAFIVAEIVNYSARIIYHRRGV